jgi:transposase InsO family protein
MADHLHAELVVDALEMAVARRRPPRGVIHHSDQGGQYVSLLFTRRCRGVGVEVSMGSRGDCFDNAVLESFHASLKKDLIHRRSWPTKAEARTAVFDYIEAFYNRRRRHSTLGMLSPVAYEQATLRDTGTSLAAPRLAPTNKINYKSTTAAQAA